MYVQLCDNSLSKDLFPNDYHCLGDNENRNLKWMAPETFKSKVHNSASDVVSCFIIEPICEVEKMGGGEQKRLNLKRTL